MEKPVQNISIGREYFWDGANRVCHPLIELNEKRIKTDLVQQFIIKGVVYQLRGQDGPEDPLADEHLDVLKQSIPLFQELGLNAIYVCLYFQLIPPFMYNASD